MLRKLLWTDIVHTFFLFSRFLLKEERNKKKQKKAAQAAQESDEYRYHWLTWYTAASSLTIIKICLWKGYGMLGRKIDWIKLQPTVIHAMHYWSWQLFVWWLLFTPSYVFSIIRNNFICENIARSFSSDFDSDELEQLARSASEGEEDDEDDDNEVSFQF